MKNTMKYGAQTRTANCSLRYTFLQEAGANCYLRYTFLQETGAPSLQSLLRLPQDHEVRPKEGQAVLEDFFMPGVKQRSRCS